MTPGLALDHMPNGSPGDAVLPRKRALAFARRVTASDFNDGRGGESGEMLPLSAHRPLGMNPQSVRVAPGSGFGAKSWPGPVATRNALWVGFASVALAGRGVGPALADLVRHVVGVRSQKQMVGANAGRIVAAVEHVHPARNWPVVDLPREPMRPYAPKGPARDSVPVPVTKRRPAPAPAAAPDIWPEQLINQPGVHGRYLHVLRAK